jgi:subtilisin family serine protease
MELTNAIGRGYFSKKKLPKIKEDEINLYTKNDLNRLVNKKVFQASNFSETKNFIPVGVWLTGAMLLWIQGFKGGNCIVGVIDSGIDPSHSDIKSIHI